uniref:MYB family transcription factor MYB7 n=1 Tax=Larix gmelinii var. olgensis TaxID=188928 RepID=A0A5J6SW71_9CONI|nr:MYB family transcription factor MYB7 [Larix gmelinii var. olgensis]
MDPPEHFQFHANNTNSNNNPDKSRGDRHFVTWSEQEDNVLREQVRIHGIERWALISSQLKDKTSRQCRRRWNTYLSTAYKKGSWSQEEDIILFEAHKKFGNRWTEIAKVVQGRTDNAVKNRFNALCKKQAKREALSKENDEQIHVNDNNKRVVVENKSILKTLDSAVCSKKMRTSNTSGVFPGDGAIKLMTQNRGSESMSHFRTALTVLPHDHLTNKGFLVSLGHSSPCDPFAAIKSPVNQGSKLQNAFLSKDNPKLTALTQQAELLSTLVQRRKVETSNKKLENSSKVLDGMLIQGKESHLRNEDEMKESSPCLDVRTNASTPFLTDKEKGPKATCLPSKRLHMPSLPKLCEPCEKTSQESSEFSLGSNYHMNFIDMPKDNLLQIGVSAFICKNKSFQTCSTNTEEKEQVHVRGKDGYSCSTASQHEISSKQTEQEDERLVPISSFAECCSPIHVTPFFRSVVDEIPTPQFSDSERQFLLSMLDPDSEISSPDCQILSRRGSPSCRTSLSNRL